MIDTTVVEVPKEDYNNFKNKLKVANSEKQKTNKVETLICFGDGLGIQTKINY